MRTALSPPRPSAQNAKPPDGRWYEASLRTVAAAQAPVSTPSTSRGANPGPSLCAARIPSSREETCSAQRCGYPSRNVAPRAAPIRAVGASVTSSPPVEGKTSRGTTIASSAFFEVEKKVATVSRGAAAMTGRGTSSASRSLASPAPSPGAAIAASVVCASNRTRAMPGASPANPNRTSTGSPRGDQDCPARRPIDPGRQQSGRGGGSGLPPVRRRSRLPVTAARTSTWRSKPERFRTTTPACAASSGLRNRGRAGSRPTGFVARSSASPEPNSSTPATATAMTRYVVSESGSAKETVVRPSSPVTTSPFQTASARKSVRSWSPPSRTPPPPPLFAPLVPYERRPTRRVRDSEVVTPSPCRSKKTAIGSGVL